MKQRMTKLLAGLLTMAMLATLVSVLAYGVDEPVNTQRKLNYLVIGDSIAAGYGMHPVNGNPDDPGNQFTLHHGQLVDGTYPKIVAEKIGATSVINTARESYTTTNYLRMIDPAFDAELARPENYYERFLSECTFIMPKLFGGIDDLTTLKTNMVRYIQEADIITIGIGNNDTFTAALLSSFFRTLYYMYGMSGQIPLTALKGQLQAITSVDQLVAMAGGYTDIFTELARRVVIYEKNYDRLIQRILELNPDVDIYYVGMYNTFADVQPADSDLVVQFREQGDILSGELKNYVKKVSPYRNVVHYVDMTGVEVWPSVPVDNVMFYMTFLVHCHPDYTGHAFMAGKLVKAMKKYSPQYF
ncbi:MAG: hypothetical protein J6T14_03045 [Clostridia bacterium]|nr:hypothetical protein [Clostridia bacterium]